MKITKVKYSNIKNKKDKIKLVKQFNSSGVIIIENVISKRKCNDIKQILETTQKKFGKLYYGRKKVLKHSGHSGAKTVTNLHNKNSKFLEFLDKKIIFDLVQSILQQGSYMNKDPIICQAFTARSPISGADKQQLHNDARIVGSKYPMVVQAMYAMDDFTKNNGATNFLLGSQRLLSFPKNNYNYRKLILAEAKAGSVIIFNGATWHGSSKPLNFSGSRWAVICRYSRWFLKPIYNFVRNTPVKVFKEMNKRQKDLLGFRYHPPLDEFTGNRSIQKKHIKPVNYNLPK